MMNMRFRKLSGLHSGHVFEVKGPANEMDTPMRWSLQCETIADQKLIVDEHELQDASRWQPLAEG